MREICIRGYKLLAFTTFNTIIVVIVLNVLLSAAFAIRDYSTAEAKPADRRIGAYRERFTDLQAYRRISPAVANEYLDQQDAMGSVGFQYEPWLQFRHREFHGSLLHTNEKGVRRTKKPQTRAGTPVKIYVFGGSTTFGYGVPDDYTVPSYLQSILEQRYQSKSILVRNFGQAFYYSSQEMLLLLSLIKNGDIPEWAVFIDGGNDTAQLLPKRDEPIFTPVLAELWDRSSGVAPEPTTDWSWIPMVRLAKGLAIRFLPERGFHEDEMEREQADRATMHRLVKSDSDFTPGAKRDMVDYVVSRYTNNMRIIRSICKEYGIECRFVWQPHVVYKYDRSLHKSFPFEGPVPDVYIGVYARMEQHKSIDFLYLGNMLENVREKVFVDDVHYNEVINEKVAVRISELLQLD